MFSGSKNVMFSAFFLVALGLYLLVFLPKAALTQQSSIRLPFSLETNQPDVKSNQAVQQHLKSRDSESIERIRIGTANASAFVSGKNRIQLNVFDDTVLDLQLSILTGADGGAYYIWEGYVITDQFEDPVHQKILEKGVGKPPVSGAFVRSALTGAKFYIRIYRRTKETGNLIAMTQLPSLPIDENGEVTGVDLSSGLLALLPSDRFDPSLHEEVVTVEGEVVIANMIYHIEPVQDDIRFLAIAEIDKSKLQQEQADFECLYCSN